MNEYMKVANDLAETSYKNDIGGPFGACIVKDDRIIGKASNHVLLKNDPTAHAEIEAIRDACKNINSYDLSGCIIFTTCYPCPMCLSAIIWANIKTVYYGNTRQDASDIGFRDDMIYKYINDLENNDNNELLDLKQINRDETIKAFEDYKKLNNKTNY